MGSQPERRPGGRWRIRYVDPGGTRRTQTFDTKKQAAEFGDQLRSDIRNQTFVDPDKGKRLFGEWAVEYLDITLPTRRATTDDGDQNYLRRYLEPQWGDRRLGSITRVDVATWAASLSKIRQPDGAPLSPSAIHHIYGTFTKIMKGAVDYELIARAPLPADPPLPKMSKSKPIRFLTEQEVAHLVGFFTEPYRALALTMAYTGVRIGEGVALRLDDVDWTRKSLRVDEGQTEPRGGLTYDEPKTPSGNRTIPLADLVVEQLRLHVENYVGWSNPRSFLFASPTGATLRAHTWRERSFYPAVSASGLDRLTPHDLRHTAASFFIADGANPWMLAEILGHSDTRMIDKVYGHLFEKDRETLRGRMSQRAAAAGLADKIIPMNRKKEA